MPFVKGRVFLLPAVFLLVLFVFGAPLKSRASDGLDIQAELARPGVKLVVVEFYATWCKPCMDAVPKWKALHEKYRRAGLRFIVVSADDDGVCSRPLDWSPDVTLCDSDGLIQRQMGVTNLPMSFLHSWEGNLAMKSPHVEPVDRAIQAYFRDTHYKIEVDPVDVIGDKYALSGNPQRVREEVVSQLRRKSKVDVVSERHTASPRKEADVCVTEFPANSTLRIKVLGYDTGERMLSLELEQDGCVRAQATHPYSGEGFEEDWGSLQRAIDRATTALLAQLVRVRAAEQVGGASGGDWFSSEELFVLRFESDPVGATVLVDNEPVCNATPCSRSFPRGVRSVTMLTADYVTRTEEVDVSQDVTVNWALTPNFGWLTLDDAPEGLEVSIDGKVAGKTPLTRHRLSPGRHVVEIASPCYEPFRVEQSITRDRESRLSAKLTAREGGIDVSAQDEQGNVLRADVFVDGMHVGAAPGRFRVNICAKELVVKSQGYRDFTQRLSLKEREIVPVKAVLGDGQQLVSVQTVSGTRDRLGIEWLYSQPAKLYFMKTEATLGMYRACVEAGACRPENHGTKSDETACNWGHSDRDNHPMNCVNWHGATEFCAWAGGRLPTEKEWSAEASNGGSREYPWGNEQASCRYAIMRDGGSGCGKGGTWPVCNKPAGNSVSGLCDMSGNVWEWTSSSWESAHVLRGGSWYGVRSGDMRVSSQRMRDPNRRSRSDGFRCVRSSR